MHGILSKGFLPLAFGTALILGGCATKDDVMKAQTSADQANAAAGRAQSSADQANSAAARAQQTADAARAAAQSANDAAQKASADAKAVSDKMDADEAAEKTRHGRRARGERG
jgi:hypothetical protein